MANDTEPRRRDPHGAGGWIAGCFETGGAMTNEELMQLMTDMGLHEGGIENWVRDNAWLRVANAVEAREREAWPAEMEAMERQVNILTDALAQAKADERAECLELAKSYAHNNTDLHSAIRARGQV